MSELAEFESRAEAAMVAAAVGDALGWPQEIRSHRVGGRRQAEPQLEFIEWRRRDGGRYAQHEEVVGAGEYSDDTQLIAAVARSLLTGEEWWRYLTRLELPLWLLYERGGGGATKQAAQSWTKGVAPWTGAAAEKYFTAGGNGVAMRVLPHCIRGGNFPEVAASIMADGIATHGHPRAHVGALVYGYTLWQALRRDSRLPYGALVEDALSNVEAWSHCPSVAQVAPDWERAFGTADGRSYDALWRRTIEEMIGLLRTCAEGIGQGALSVDRETLEALGAFDKQVNGAGTVTAASALFLASRYASRAPQGLIAAAFASGADTDTLASMAGSVLAAINGLDWLGRLRERVQDDRYLTRLARNLVVGEVHKVSIPPKATFVSLRNDLSRSEIGASLSLPDGRIGRVGNIVSHPTNTRNDIKTIVVETSDGQTLFFKRIQRIREDRNAAVVGTERRIGVAMQVADVERAIAFWRDVAGLEVSRADGYVSVGGGQIELIPSDTPTAVPLKLAPGGDLRKPLAWVVVYVDRDLDAVRRRVRQASLKYVSTIGPGSSWEGIRCLDSDENVIEFRGRRPSG